MEQVVSNSDTMFQIYVLLRSSLMMFFALNINFLQKQIPRITVSLLWFTTKKKRNAYYTLCLSLMSFFLLSSPCLSLIYYSFSFSIFSYSCCFFFHSSFSHIRYPLYAILSFFIYSMLIVHFTSVVLPCYYGY